MASCARRDETLTQRKKYEIRSMLMIMSLSNDLKGCIACMPGLFISHSVWDDVSISSNRE